MFKFSSLTAKAHAIAAAFIVAAATPTLAAIEEYIIVPAAVDFSLGEQIELTPELIFDPTEAFEAFEEAQRSSKEHVVEVAQNYHYHPYLSRDELRLLNSYSFQKNHAGRITNLPSRRMTITRGWP